MMTDLQKLNAEVAKIFGWENLHWVAGGKEGSTIAPTGWYGDGPNGESYLVKDYTSYADMWLVVDEMKARGFRFELYIGYETSSSTFVSATVIGRGEDRETPIAICKAALASYAKWGVSWRNRRKLYDK